MAESIQFHKAPRAVYLAGSPPPARTYTEEELEAARMEAYQRGAEEAQAMLESQMLELRTEAMRLQSETFAALTAQHEALEEQFRALLPEWASEAVKRILAGTPVPEEAVLRIVREMLEQVEPGREAVEVRLNAQDLKAIEGNEEQFREKHPAIIFQSDASLRPGDCVVRSRFGTLDGRLATKLAAVEEVLRG